MKPSQTTRDHREPREWKLRGEDAEQEILTQIAHLKSSTSLSSLTLRTCITRGLTTADAIQDFLNPRFEKLCSPLKIRDMEKAVERLARAREAKEEIRIFGDYDVDGTTGAALLSWIFKDYGQFIFSARQPDRFKDGYGLNVKAVEEAVTDGARVLLTVDCGITSFEAAKRAEELGIDLIIVDHHQLDAKLGMPHAIAVINPQRADCESDLKQLCGCGLAFYLAMALRSHGRAKGWWPPGFEPNLKQHLDLVVMATAADMVPLTGDNHVLVRYGLDVLKQSKKPGVKALLEAAGLGSRDISPGHLGFVIGPRINASGRMVSASLALELLTTEDLGRAVELARTLEKLNDERAATQNAIWDQVRTQVEQGIAEGRFQHGIVVADAGWHEGVVGIVASRVTETFRRPAAVIALREDFGKGSVRSYGGKDVLAALRACSETLKGFGGHKYAAGLSVEHDRLDAFILAFDAALGEMREDAKTLPLYVEGKCSLDDLSVKTLEELEKLGPFGPGNPEPVFICTAIVRHQTILKGRHLKMSLGGGKAAAGAPPVEAIWFGAAEDESIVNETAEGHESEWAGVPELNRFRGRVTPTFRVRDWRKPSNG